MNLHLEGITFDQLLVALQIVTRGRPGYVLASGRHYHFYGRYLLTPEEWLRFNCDFLLPTMLVSPRYISHSLSQGHNTLRLSAQGSLKPVTPYLVATI